MKAFLACMLALLMSVAVFGQQFDSYAATVRVSQTPVRSAPFADHMPALILIKVSRSRFIVKPGMAFSRFDLYMIRIVGCGRTSWNCIPMVNMRPSDDLASLPGLGASGMNL